jgi:hypothetical protein
MALDGIAFEKIAGSNISPALRPAENFVVFDYSMPGMTNAGAWPRRPRRSGARRLIRSAAT